MKTIKKEKNRKE